MERKDTRDEISRRLEECNIDPHIRGLIAELWNHGYQTLYSCQGGGVGEIPELGIRDHNREGYVLLIDGTGDGWLETIANKSGLQRVPRKPCCLIEAAQAHPSQNACHECGAGIHGRARYVFNLKEPWPYQL